jgi:hypothetical protein
VEFRIESAVPIINGVGLSTTAEKRARFWI